MSDDLIDRLARENPQPQDMPPLPIEPVLRRLDDTPPAGTSRRSPAGRARWRRVIGGLPVAGAVIATLAVVAMAIIFVGHKRSAAPPGNRTPPTHHHSPFGPPPRDPGPIPHNVDDGAVATAWNTAWAKDPTCRPGPRPAAGSRVSYATPSAAMLSTIPALRRPATRADRLPASSYINGRLRPLEFQGGEVYARYIRRARVADGITFYLIPAAKLGRPPLSPAAANRCYRLTVAALQAQLPTIPPAKRAATLRYGDAEFALGRYNLETSSVHEGVFLFTERANGGGADGGQSPSTIQQTGMLGGGGGGTPPSPIVMDGIVPAGVATVTLQFPASRHGSRRLPARSATGDVVNNVFVIPIPTLFQRGSWPTTATWRSASGKVIKTVNERPFHP